MYRLFLLLLFSIALTSIPTLAQPAADSVEAQVTFGLHGADGQGRDGPMSKLSRDLVELYYQYRAFRSTGRTEPFVSEDQTLPVRDSLVTIDAIAAQSPEVLLDSLRAIGLQEAARSERLVSGKLPILNLNRASRLSLLQSMRAARSRSGARSGNGVSVRENEEKSPGEAESGPKKERKPQTSTGSTDSLKNHGISPESQQQSADTGGWISLPKYWLVGGAVLLLIGFALVFFGSSSAVD
ncbi:hypothetical protein BSZ35_18170 [Salinibacter sp. 10B]|nr:hypothetical protein BSZ35_18170 [Salinibacter sp. 10B]